MTRCNENTLLMTDVYKVGHEGFYPDGLTNIYSYLTTRSDKRYPRVVFAGLQALIKKTLMNPVTTDNVEEFVKIHQMILGKKPSDRMTARLHGLVALGYYPLKIKAVKSLRNPKVSYISNAFLPEIMLESTF